MSKALKQRVDDVARRIAARVRTAWNEEPGLILSVGGIIVAAAAIACIAIRQAP